MGKDPAFLMYSKDWLEGTAEYMPEEKGVYIDLLCYQHQRGSIPSDNIRLAKMVGLTVEQFNKIWDVISIHFNRTDNRLVNQKLKGIMEERSTKSKVNTITGTFAGILKSNKEKISNAEYKVIKAEFSYKDFIEIPKECLTERLTEWLYKRLKSIEDEDGNIDLINSSNIKGENLIFYPPSLESIKEYCTERNNNVDPEKWYDFYQSKGWMIGKNKMKDWKAAIRTWENKENKQFKKNKHVLTVEDFREDK